MNNILRPYQIKTKEIARREFAKHDRLLVWLPTGAGKGVLMANIVSDIVKRQKTVLTVVKMRQIVTQTYRNYHKAGIPSNFFMGSERIAYSHLHLSSIASIDTLISWLRYDIPPNYYERLKKLREVSLVIIDEAHNCTAESYCRFIWWLEGEPLIDFTMEKFHAKKDFKKKYLGFSATPFPIGRKTHQFFQAVINTATPEELRDHGYLVQARVFRPKKMVSREGLKINSQTGDYQNKQLFKRFAQKEVVGDVVEMYRKHGKNKRAICFAINVEHSKQLAAQFLKAGIGAIHCDAGHTKKERDQAIGLLKNERIKVLCNVNIFSVGMDCPWIEVAICARPTASEVLAVQQWGRVLRPYKICSDCDSDCGAEMECPCGHKYFRREKIEAIILDHANNTGKFGLPYDTRVPTIEAGHIPEKKENPVKTCPQCHATVPSNATSCPYCQRVFGKSKEEMQVDHSVGELTEVKEKTELRESIWKDFNTYRRLEIMYHWHHNAKWHKLMERHGKKLLPYAKELNIPSRWQIKIKQYEKNEPVRKTSIRN